GRAAQVRNASGKNGPGAPGRDRPGTAEPDGPPRAGGTGQVGRGCGTMAGVPSEEPPVTEVEWAACTTPMALLVPLRQAGQDSERKLRLGACACLRAVWPHLPDERSRAAVEAAERWADRTIRQRALKAAGKAAWEALQGEPDLAAAAAYHATQSGTRGG